jgi:pilus assembly protein Flp/PilA
LLLPGVLFYSFYTKSGEVPKEGDMSERLSVLKSEAGQGLMEYALILMLVAIIVVAALTLLGSSISQALLGPVVSSV